MKRTRSEKRKRPLQPRPPGPLSLHLQVPERSSPARVRSGQSFLTRKRFSSAAHTSRALAASGPFRKLSYEKEKGANAKAKPSSVCGLVLPPDGRPPPDSVRVASI